MGGAVEAVCEVSKIQSITCAPAGGFSTFCARLPPCQWNVTIEHTDGLVREMTGFTRTYPWYQGSGCVLDDLRDFCEAFLEFDQERQNRKQLESVSIIA